MTHEKHANATIRKCLRALAAYGEPLTVAGIAEECGYKACNTIPVWKMQREGLIELVGVIEGYVSWRITDKGRELIA